MRPAGQDHAIAFGCKEKGPAEAGPVNNHRKIKKRRILSKKRYIQVTRICTRTQGTSVRYSHPLVPLPLYERTCERIAPFRAAQFPLARPNEIRG